VRDDAERVPVATRSSIRLQELVLALHRHSRSECRGKRFETPAVSLLRLGPVIAEGHELFPMNCLSEKGTDDWAFLMRSACDSAPPPFPVISSGLS
jgi:hypothetical protein